jgi:hypothetical protein
MWAVTLAVKRISTSHSAENIKEMVTKVLEKFSINPQCYVADNASNQVLANDLLANWSNEQLDKLDPELEKVLETSATEMLSPDSDVFAEVQRAFELPTEAYGCHCHHLELVIKHAMKPMKRSLDLLRSFGVTLRSNSTFARCIATFNDGKSPHLPADVSTRWSSTFRLISAFLTNIEVFQKASHAFQAGELRDEDVDQSAMEALSEMLAPRFQRRLCLVRDALAPLADAVSLLEGDQYPTLSYVQLLGWLLKEHVGELLAKETGRHHNSSIAIQVFQLILKELKERFEYETFPLPSGYMPVDYIAAALDPHTKTLPFLDPALHDLVWKHLDSLISSSSSSNRVIEDTNSTPSTSKGSELLRHLSVRLQNYMNTSSSNEVDTYRAMPTLDICDDPLTWWREREAQLPSLARLARTYLALTASSATVERIFSRGALVMSNKRIRLHDDSLESQIIANRNQDFIEHIDKKNRLK